ncbi:hypothetical protein [Butyrivibrio sp. MB2005]|uniref:hypothetical protein n=1 Tax=Butyrivibrio sp. MB2005 TaxID=1280678 RepID=UPI00042389DB|nr:hypothetical protein [Butyrivibrio sp. MB2005]
MKSNNSVLWKDYLGLGLLVSIIISLLDYSRDGYLHIALVIAFIFLSGLKESVRLLISFIRKHPIIVVLMGILTVYFRIFSRTEPFSDKFSVSVYLLIFSGYVIGNVSDNIKENYVLVWKALMVLSVMALFHYVQVFQNGERMSAAFQNPVLEADAMIVLLLISVLYIDNVYMKIAGIVIANVCIVLTSVRVCMIMAFFIVILYVFIHRDIVVDRVRTIDSNKRNVLIVGVVICGLLLGVVFRNALFNIFVITVTRFGALFRVIKGDFSLGNDYSIGTRVLAIREILKLYPEGTIIEMLLGRGQLHGYYAIKNSMSELTGVNAASEYAGPIENTLLSILYDYGLLSAALYAVVFIKISISAIISKDNTIRRVAIFSFCMIVLSLFVDMEYWMNLSFVLFTGIGIYIGATDKFNGHCVNEGKL